MDKDSKINKEEINYNQTFIRYILGLQTGAMVALGNLKNPATDNYEKDIDQAREIINIIGMMKQKTKGNLSSHENLFLEKVLTKLQMEYVNKFVEKGD